MYDYATDQHPDTTWADVVRSDAPLNWRRGIDSPGVSLAEGLGQMWRELNQRRVRSGRERSRE